ncbi:hypothetical protein PSP6_160068 [Paraburkholderia tropica]|nr:hypothetical protein PSP6_160068 [Paraburkholderia tropica]
MIAARVGASGGAGRRIAVPGAPQSRAVSRSAGRECDVFCLHTNIDARPESIELHAAA